MIKKITKSAFIGLLCLSFQANAADSNLPEKNENYSIQTDSFISSNGTNPSEVVFMNDR